MDGSLLNTVIYESPPTSPPARSLCVLIQAANPQPGECVLDVGYRTLDDTIQQHLGMLALQDIFALDDANELRTLLKDAGFQRLEIEPASMTARFPNPDGFLAGEIDVDTAAIPSMQHLDAQARQAITAAICEDMQSRYARSRRAITWYSHSMHTLCVLRDNWRRQ